MPVLADNTRQHTNPVAGPITNAAPPKSALAIQPSERRDAKAASTFTADDASSSFLGALGAHDALDEVAFIRKFDLEVGPRVRRR